MSDDLVKRLRDEHVAASRTEAADRIEELEAKLAKAVEALHEAMYFLDPDAEDILKGAGIYRIVKAYAELGAVIPQEWADALRDMKGFNDE